MSLPQNFQVTTVNVLPDLGPRGFSCIMLTGLPLWPLRSPPFPGFSLYPRKNGHSELLPQFLPRQAMAPVKTRPKRATLATGRASSKGSRPTSVAEERPVLSTSPSALPLKGWRTSWLLEKRPQSGLHLGGLLGPWCPSLGQHSRTLRQVDWMIMDH